MGAPSNMDSSSTRKVVVLTAIPSEFKAVCAHLRSPYEERHEMGDVYKRGLFDGEEGTWDVLVVETGPGNRDAAWSTERALQYFAPNVAFFVGVAGGLRDVAVGDVVAATKVYGYESGKASASFEPRPEFSRGSHALESRAKAVVDAGQWRSRIRGRDVAHSPRAVAKPIASGEKVVADTRSELNQFLQNQFGDAVAVEMEGLGFLNAARARNVEALVIRGISDGIDGKAESDAKGSQELAASHASAFAFEVLSKFSASKATTSGAHPAFTPSSNAAEASQPPAPVREAHPVSPSRSSGINLRNVMIVLLLGALGFLALQMLGRSSRPSRGSWQPQGPHSGSRTDWHRSYPPR